MLTDSERRARLLDYMEGDRILRGKWTYRDKNGRELACLLAALVPEIGIKEATSQNAKPEPLGLAKLCPATLMPLWLASFTPIIDDCVSPPIWKETIREYAQLIHGWNVLTPVAWEHLRIELCDALIDTARRALGGPRDVWHSLREELHGVPRQDRLGTSSRASAAQHSIARIMIGGSLGGTTEAERRALALTEFTAGLIDVSLTAAIDKSPAKALSQPERSRVIGSVIDPVVAVLFAAIRREISAAMLQPVPIEVEPLPAVGSKGFERMVERV